MFNLKFTFTQSSNKFHVLSSLTEWHFSARKELNNFLIEKYGALSQKQKGAIEGFKEILGDTASGPKFIGSVFFEENFAFDYKKFEHLLSKQQFTELKSIFNILEPWWDRVWQGESKSLEAWKEELIKSDIKNREVAEAARILFGKAPTDSQTVFLLLGTPKNIGGGVNVGKGKITLECSGKDPINDTNSVAGTLWHEIIHIFENSISERIDNYIKESPMKFLKGSRLMQVTGGFRVQNYFREAIAYSLFPSGYLGQKYLNQQSMSPAYRVVFEKKISKAPLRWKWSVLATCKLAKKAEQYITEGKEVDDEFLGVIEKLLKEFTEFVEEN